MKMLLVLALFAIGFNASASTELSCVASGIVPEHVTMVKETSKRYVVSAKVYGDQGEVVSQVTTTLHVQASTKNASGDTMYTGVATRPVSPDGSAYFTFDLQLSNDEVHASLSLKNQEGEVANVYAFTCTHPDNR